MSSTEFVIQIDNPQITQLGLAADIDFFQSMSVSQLACEGLVAVTLGVPDVDLNGVIDTQTSADSILEKIDKVIAFFQEQRVNWRWVVRPLSKPPDLSCYLKQKGFYLLNTSPGMYIDLTKARLPIIPFKNWEIREMPAEDDLADWISPILAAFPHRDRLKTYQTINARLPHGPGTPFRHYVGYYRQQPASSMTLFISHQTVSVHNLAILPVFSHRGFGKKLLSYGLLETQKMGFKHCFLEASQSGFKLYRRMGFQVYCVYHNYSRMGL